MEKEDLKKYKEDLKKTKKKSNFNYKWVFIVTIVAFLLSLSFSSLADFVMKNVNVFLSTIILIIFIGLGVVFDIIGVAVTSADVKPFHSMSARKMKVGIVAVKLKKNAEKVSSICNDVIGDVCGILSGSAGAMIAANLADKISTFIPISLIITAIVAALTIGGKALCKGFAIAKSDVILYNFSKVLGMFYRTKQNLK